jgi:zinc finger CCHC domain-containing protein 8
LQRNFELDIVNIQDPGQEHWRKKYVYWIPALHIDGQEVAKGRWDGQTIIQALDAWQKSHLATSEDGSKKQS